jgi:hypothetical protein
MRVAARILLMAITVRNSIKENARLKGVRSRKLVGG